MYGSGRLMLGMLMYWELAELKYKLWPPVYGTWVILEVGIVGPAVPVSEPSLPVVSAKRLTALNG